jgi:hypothetical protein
MSQPTIRPSTKLPKNVAIKIATRFRVPKTDRELFCKYLSDRVERIWKRDWRATFSKPSSSLRRAADATRTLQRALDSLPKKDREWVNSMCARSQLWGEGLPALDTTVMNLALVFNHAVGRPSPMPRQSMVLNEKLGVRTLSVKNQMFKEVVIVLMSAAVENHGKYTLDSNTGRGTLIDALNMIGPYLPPGLVPAPHKLPAGTIQKIKRHFEQTRT